MNMLMYFLLSLGWLITGIVNVTRHAHWTGIALDFVLFVVFAVLGVRRAVRSMEDDGGK